MTIKSAKDRFLSSFNRLNIAEKPEIVDWLLFGIVALFAFASFLYGDIRAVNNRQVELIDALLKGRFFDFHQYVIEKSTLQSPSYDILIYIIFAAWNFPLYIIKNVFNVDIFASYPCLLYFKSMLPFFSAGSAWILYKICLAMNIKKDIAKWAVFLFFTSAYFFIPVLVIVQYDIICLFFMLTGFYFYLKDNTKLFLIFFSITVPLKFFSIFIFIPLVLLKEKRILRIIISCGLVMAVLVVLRLLFPGHSAVPVEDDAFRRLTTTPLKVFEFASSSLPIFLIIYALVCAYCYFKIPSSEDKSKISSYVCLFIYLTLSMSIAFHPYWIVFASPFVVLVIVQNLDKLKLNLLLDAGGMLGLIIWQTQMWYWVYSKNINLYNIAKLWPISDYKYENIVSLFNKNGLGKYFPIFYALYIGCSIAFLILNFPRKDRDIQQNQRFERGLVLTRFGVPVLIVVLNFYIFCIPADQSAISTIDYPSLPSPISLDNPAVIKQELVFGQDLTLEELQLLCYKKTISGRDRFGSLTVSLFEEEKIVFTSRIFFHSIPDSALYNIDMKNTKIKANKKYALRLGVRDRVKVGFNIALAKFPVLGEAMPLYINGKKTDMNLYFKLTARPFHEYSEPVKKELVKPNAEISGARLWVSSYDDESVVAAVTVKNTGESAWNRKTGVYLAAERESDETWCGQSNLLADVDINPGEEVAFYVAITGSVADRYRFVMIDNTDGKTSKGIGRFSEYYQIPNTAEFIDAKLFWENSSPIAEVKVKNTGAITWSRQNSAAHTFIASWAYSGNDSNVGSWSGNEDIETGIQVKPGEEYTFRVKLANEQTAGTVYRFIMIRAKDGEQHVIGDWSDDYRFE